MNRWPLIVILLMFCAAALFGIHQVWPALDTAPWLGLTAIYVVGVIQGFVTAHIDRRRDDHPL